MRPIAGIDAYLGLGNILWFGEMHGTEESPRFVGDVACHAARVGRVRLGLEIAIDEQPRIDLYLRGRGGPAERAALIAGEFWRHHDGRSSQAMVALIERARGLRVAGASIDVVAYDELADDRDAAMAQVIAGARDAASVVIVLSGNVHSRRTIGVPWDPAFVPAVAHLVTCGAPVATFDVVADGGTFWACISTGPDDPSRCGEHPNRRNEHAGDPWTLGPARDASHDGVYRVGSTTASPPATDEPRG